MLIDIDIEEIIKGTIQSYMPVEDIWIEELRDNVIVDIENWLADYGLYTKIVDEIVKRFREMGVEISE